MIFYLDEELDCDLAANLVQNSHHDLIQELPYGYWHIVLNQVVNLYVLKHFLKTTEPDNLAIYWIHLVLIVANRQ